ncbi:LysR substrate-binding domain-containing protein [Hirschia baltica]|uniref:Transcriptional regulator, LysR family n=1 Tax=Hirschia baltica (strain ATCC 49814 / DSM 5838 / IFAM 1418) TaxID=582402 RepID=C6XP11_HIRBI|nr:LysR substrate-binding domain-containing protein [Hirschia baltica]ACT60191.1 transcriptional regulator, LysR family [Hirschia baltica ATCC 49814]
MENPSKFNSNLPPSRKSLPPFEALRAFDAVARLGGIRKAANWLERDHAVLSRHLRSIEKWAGVPLIERSTAGTSLTEEGQKYHLAVSKALDSISHASLDLLYSGTHHQLNIWCIPGFATNWLSLHLSSMETTNSDVDLQLRPSVDSPDFLSHEADADIRVQRNYGEQEVLADHLQAVPLAVLPIIPVANRKYLESLTEIETPAHLLEHHLLHERSTSTWETWLKSHNVPCDNTLKGIKLWQGDLTLDAARHGQGIVLTNPLVASRFIERGELIEIGKDNPNFPTRTASYVMIARKDRWNEPVLRRFRNWMHRTIRKELPLYTPK